MTLTDVAQNISCNALQIDVIDTCTQLLHKGLNEPLFWAHRDFLIIKMAIIIDAGSIRRPDD